MTKQIETTFKQPAGMHAEHPPEVLSLAQKLRAAGIRNPLAAAYSARPAQPNKPA